MHQRAGPSLSGRQRHIIHLVATVDQGPRVLRGGEHCSANTRAANAYDAAATATAVAALEQQQLERLENPRTVTTAQENEIIKALKNAPKGPLSVVAAQWDTTDAKPYAASIEHVLKKAGFTLADPPSAFKSSLYWSTPGAGILVRDLKHAPLQAVAIQKAFASIGQYLEGSPPDSPEKLKPDEVMIWVGSHPFKPADVPTALKAVK